MLDATEASAAACSRASRAKQGYVEVAEKGTMHGHEHPGTRLGRALTVVGARRGLLPALVLPLVSLACAGQTRTAEAPRAPARSLPEPADSLPPITDVAAGTAHTCVLRGEALYCFGGIGSPGECGAEGACFLPTPVLPELRFRLVDANHGTCALTTDERLFCWYDIGDRLAGEHAEIRAVELAETGITSVAESSSVLCVLLADGRVHCDAWGGGPGGLAERFGLAGDAAIPPVSSIDTGTTHVCAATREGRVFCWGSSHRCTAGCERVRGPQPIEGLAEVSDVVLGFAHSCALSRSGRAYCWGWNRWGQSDPTTVSDEIYPQWRFSMA